MRRLVVAPHMDDESLGCGGLLAKYPSECSVLVVTDSGSTRAAEHENAMAVLGIRQSECLAYPDGRVHERTAELVRDLDEALARLRPDEVYLPYPSLHQDHIAVYEAGMRSCRISMSVEHWVPSTVLVYDIAVYDLNLYPSDLRWNVFESLSADEVDLKARACLAYQTEIPTDAHPINAVQAMAKAVGNARLLDYAEQYALVRQVRR